MHTIITKIQYTLEHGRPVEVKKGTLAEQVIKVIQQSSIKGGAS